MASKGGLGPFTCDCGRQYKYQKNLSQHKRLECGREPRFSCTLCPYKAKQKSGKLPFRCLLCGRSYTRRDNLTRHQKFECLTEPQFACTECPYRARQKVHLKSHLAIKHGSVPRPYICEDCGRSYSRKDNLHRHQKLECNKAPTFAFCVVGQYSIFGHAVLGGEKFECSSCHRTYAYKKNLLQHQPECHKCTWCQRVYQHKHNLIQHLQHYCGKGAQFPCPHCSYKATQKGSLKRHLCLKHNQLMTDGVTFEVLQDKSGSNSQYQCLACTRIYLHKENLIDHQRFECVKGLYKWHSSMST
ncbi:gastrula zinc finger protein XlCGF7.1-like [Macrosteles quadrilineatus]|uniref:gastrula zinc finger protein XlCGF7.1-like n=1 Tax=Macrosteles quadrilineatus TaxID=74068 RepID=UPI0023E0B0D0|nr:gastrula zinc finger protein XlCGF7.1-like [Macrosteles quadrilineatus]